MPTMNNTCVILGTGPLGLAVMDELVVAGQAVTVTNRSGRISETLPPGVTLKQADLTSPEQVAAVCAGADVVFHCAQPAYTEWPEKFPPLTASILEGVSRTGAKLVFGDNLYMYGSTGGAPIREDLPYAAAGRKGRTRARMAQALLDAHKAGKSRVTIGRASDFYGPRVLDSAVGDIVFGAALEGKPLNLLGNIDLPHTYTYIRDFARGLVTLSEHDEAYGAAWHVPSAQTLTTRELVHLIGEQVGRPLKVRTAGPVILSLLALFNPTLREMQEMMYEFNEPYIVDHSRFAAAFGEAPTPHPIAVQETLAWYRGHLAA